MPETGPYYPLNPPPWPSGLDQPPLDPGTFTHTWSLPDSVGKPNSTDGWYGTINLAGQVLTNRSLTLTSAWERIFSQTIYPGEEGGKVITVSAGTTVTDTNGTTIGAGIEYKGISAEFSKTTEHSVSFEKSRTVSENITVKGLDEPVTVIKWQQVNTWVLTFDSYLHVGMPWYAPDIDQHAYGLKQTFVDRKAHIPETRFPRFGA